MKKVLPLAGLSRHRPSYSFFVLLLCFTLPLSGQNTSFCGTTGGGPGSIGALGQSFGPPASPSGPFYIRVYPHVVRLSDGSGGQSDAAIDAAFARLAADFNPHNIFFVRAACGVIDVPVADVDYNAYIACDLWQNPLYQHTDGIDIFFGTEDNVYQGGIARDIPSKALWISGTWPIGQGAPWNTVVSPVVSHEMAHCLGLWHTFHGTLTEINLDCQGTSTTPAQCCELVNGSNSASCGDYVKDTDADPLYWYQGFTSSPPCVGTLYWTAISTATNCTTVDAGTFVRHDINGDVYTPLLDNTMSYNQSLLCLTGFTAGQGERMRQIIATSSILQACLVQPDLIGVTISTNTTWTTANTPHGGDFLIEGDLTILGGATLTIGSGVRVRFGEHSRTIIRPNGRLRLGGTLTSMGCSQTWPGVEVWGSLPSQSQYAVGGVRAQGRLEGLSGGVIENAKTGAKLYGPTAAYAGGQISCNSTTFRNNVVGIDFANYLNFWPFTTPTQPRGYLGSISRCAFITDDEYPHTQPFNSFIYMSGVNGVSIAGTSFTNLQTVTSTSIDAWGYGIQAVDAGFTVTSSANGIVYPPTSYTFSGFTGLGYAIQAQTSTVNRPFTVRQTNFDRCFVGIRNWAVDGATILFNNFNLGELPSTDPTADQVGIIFETDVSGFTCEENEFTKITGKTEVTAIGCISINTGDQHKQIRRNTYTAMNIGNLANQQNAYIDDPNTPVDDGIVRGLYYDCNKNVNVLDDAGMDFSVPDGLIRPQQGLEIVLPGGDIGYVSAGNRFSYTAIDFSNYGASIRYYYDPTGVNQDPLVTQPTGGVVDVAAKDNACAQSFCEPPCKTIRELEDIKMDYYRKRKSSTLLNFNNPVGNLTDAQKAARAYYQYKMDQDAYIVVLHLLYDTIQDNTDSLRLWLANMNSIEGDLWLANSYLASGSLTQANNVLNAMTAKHHLIPDKQADIADVKSISAAIVGQDPNNLNATTLQTLQTIADGKDGYARGWARRLLTQHGWHFPPEYIKDGEKNEKRDHATTTTSPKQELQVQPNPASDQVVFTLPGSATNAVLRIFDTNGRLVTLFTDLPADRSLTWQTGNAVSGIYYYYFVAEGKSWSGKILLKK